MAKVQIPAAVRREDDPEWRAWFQDVHNRKSDRDRESRGLRISLSEDEEGKAKKIFRYATPPQAVKKILGREKRKRGPEAILDQETLNQVWKNAAGRETAEQSEAQSFKNGILTVSIASASLLQEIRQFRQNELLASLRREWPANIPLIRIRYHAG